MASHKKHEPLPRPLVVVGVSGIVFFIIISLLLSLPYLFALTYEAPTRGGVQPFPVTVDPRTKTIHEDPLVNAQLSNQDNALTASAGGTNLVIGSLFAAITDTPWYGLLAASDAPQIVEVYPGERKEQIAATFAKRLDWSSKDAAAFLTATSSKSGIPDGTFAPETYVVYHGETPIQVRAAIDEQFAASILDRYSTSTEAIVPLHDTLTIAAMLERETSDPDEMRTISGIIWNRLFSGMKLQVDATVQYAKGTSKNWWPAMLPRDAYIKSPYNTYLNTGLPPGPISNPSVAAVLAALNPRETDCLYYFHDANGGFHCSATYAAHVALLKQWYGRGK